ncbi:hypothetical protein Tco_0163459 [Tanacetum coccineum]
MPKSSSLQSNSSRSANALLTVVVPIAQGRMKLHGSFSLDVEYVLYLLMCILGIAYSSAGVVKGKILFKCEVSMLISPTSSDSGLRLIKGIDVVDWSKRSVSSGPKLSFGIGERCSHPRVTASSSHK